MTRTFIAAAALTCLASTAPAEGDWIVGIIIDGGQSPYVGGKDSVQAIPYVAYETDTFHIGIDGLSYTVIDEGPLSLEARLEPRFSPDFPGTELFDGLDRDDALEAGLSATYSFGQAYATASVEGDISGAHDGYSGSLAVGYETQIGFAVIDATAGLRFRDSNLNNYLYGVGTEDATAARSAFDMSDTANVFAEITALVPLAEDLFLIGEVSFADLGDAADSPLVDRDKVADLTIGVGYQF